MPGHGPLAGPDAVRELQAYFEYLYEQARVCHADGMTPLQAARAISLERWADWGERERLVVNIANIYAELSGDQEPPNPLAAFEQMAELARALRQAPLGERPGCGPSNGLTVTLPHGAGGEDRGAGGNRVERGRSARGSRRGRRRIDVHPRRTRSAIPTTAPKRAYLMSHRERDRCELHRAAASERRDRAQRHRRAVAGLVEQALRPRLRARLRRACRRPGPTRSRSPGRRRRPRRRSRSRRAQRSTQQPLANALSFYENERDGPEYIPSPLRTAPAHLNDEDATTYLTPTVNARRRIQRRTDEPRRNDRRVRRLVGRRRLPEVRADDELRGRPDAHRRARLPRRDGRRGRRARTSPQRRASAWNGCCGCGTTRRARSTTRSASARATRARSATTTSGGCRRKTTRYGGERPRLPLHPPPARVPRRARPARPSARTSPDATPPPSRSASRSSTQTRPGTRRTLPARGRAHLRTGQHRPAGATC